MTTNYRRGADFEREVRTLLQKNGHKCWRAAGSKGEGNVDLIANANGRWVLVQCKKNGNVSNEELALLKETAMSCGAEWLVAFKQSGAIWFFQEEKETAVNYIG